MDKMTFIPPHDIEGQREDIHRNQRRGRPDGPAACPPVPAGSRPGSRRGLEVPGHPLVGRDIGEVCGLGRLGVALRDELPAERRVEVLIDFLHAGWHDDGFAAVPESAHPARRRHDGAHGAAEAGNRGGSPRDPRC